MADVVLPGAVWCEDEGTTTNLEGRVIKINRAADPPGEARRDIDIVLDLAKRLGRGEFFPYRTSRDIWEELRVASKGGVADYSGITWEKIDAQDGVFWPCPSEDHPGHLACTRSASAIRMGGRACLPSNMPRLPRSRVATFLSV